MKSLETLADEMLGRLFVPVEASGRHVHVTKEQAKILFGTSLTPKRPLSQPGQFLSHQRVTIIGENGSITNVAVLGPERPAGQVELSLTDGVALGISLPIRQSGDIAGTPGIILKGPAGEVCLPCGVIAAQRHIHLTPEAAARLGLQDKEIVKLKPMTQRPVIFEDVVVRVNSDFSPSAHLDYDEANACAFQKGDWGLILK